MLQIELLPEVQLEPVLQLELEQTLQIELLPEVQLDSQCYS